MTFYNLFDIRKLYVTVYYTVGIDGQCGPFATDIEAARTLGTHGGQQAVVFHGLLERFHQFFAVGFATALFTFGFLVGADKDVFLILHIFFLKDKEGKNISLE